MSPLNYRTLVKEHKFYFNNFWSIYWMMNLMINRVKPKQNEKPQIQSINLSLPISHVFFF